MAPLAGPDRVGRLHVLTDPAGPRPVLEVVDLALAAGVPVIQVRQKSGTDRERHALAVAVTTACRAAGATCIVDDRVDLALAAGADGVHIGDEDLPVEVVRRLLGPDGLLGVTARDPEAAVAAHSGGADYLGVGPVNATSTKGGLPEPIGVAGVADVVRAVPIPVIAIAGVTTEHVPALLDAGAHGVAVTAAVARADDPTAACRALLDAVGAVDGAMR